MTDSLVVSPSMLATVSTPEEARQLETLSSTAIAYAKEQNDYELYMQAWRVYVLARRKTTELIQAELATRNINVTDADYGFTKMQWSRRLKELALPDTKVNEYFDAIVSVGWNPSIAGMFRHADGQDIDRYERAVADVLRGANALLDRFVDRLTQAQKAALQAVRKLLEAA